MNFIVNYHYDFDRSATTLTNTRTGGFVEIDLPIARTRIGVRAISSIQPRLSISPFAAHE